MNHHLELTFQESNSLFIRCNYNALTSATAQKLKSESEEKAQLLIQLEVQLQQKQSLLLQKAEEIEKSNRDYHISLEDHNKLQSSLQVLVCNISSLLISIAIPKE